MFFLVEKKKRCAGEGEGVDAKMEGGSKKIQDETTPERDPNRFGKRGDVIDDGKEGGERVEGERKEKCAEESWDEGEGKEEEKGDRS